MITKTLKLEELATCKWKDVLSEIAKGNHSVTVHLPTGEDVTIQPSAMPNQSGYEHIVFDENGIPYIKGTTMKVVELLLDKLAYGWSPEELQLNFPHITLAQILSALAYYEDHKEQLDQDIEQRTEYVHTLEREAAARGPSPVVKRLKKKGLL